MAMRDIARRARRRPKALGSRRSGRAGEPPEGVGKPCRCPASPAASLLPARWPDGSPARSLWVIISAPWYYVAKFHRPQNWNCRAPLVMSLFAGGHNAPASQDIYCKAAKSSDPGHKAVRRREVWRTFFARICHHMSEFPEVVVRNCVRLSPRPPPGKGQGSCSWAGVASPRR